MTTQLNNPYHTTIERVAYEQGYYAAKYGVSCVCYYPDAQSAYKAGEAAYHAQSKHTSESGQAMLLLLILIVGVLLLLYVSYSGVSILSGSTNILGTMMNGLSEVLR